MQKVIIDSDWGGDVLQLASILLARPEAYEVLGATVTFGNAPLLQNVENAGGILRLLGVDRSVPRFAGARAPIGVAAQPEGDDAHGRTGLGNVVLQASEVPVSEQSAVEFILETVRSEPENSLVLVATGPQSNLAQAIIEAPEVMSRLKEIRIMGGCVRTMPAYRVDGELNRLSDTKVPRQGNITEFGEFNFQQAPKDAETVLKSGIPVSLFPMDCTHQLTFTPQREAKLREALSGWGAGVEKLVGLLNGPKLMDRQKFDIDPVMHDVHTTVSMVEPEHYSGQRGTVNICVEGEKAGLTEFVPSLNGPHWVAETIVDPDAVLDILIRSLQDLVL